MYSLTATIELDAPAHPLYEVVTDTELVTRTELVDWNVTDPSRPALVFRIDGDREAVVEALEAIDSVLAVAAAPVDARGGYVYVLHESTGRERALFAPTEHHLVVVPPVVFHLDMRIETRLVGPRAELVAAVEALPDAVDVSIDRIAAGDLGRQSPADVLTSRQREAVAAGLELGYYDVPRTASHEAVAERIGCAPSTAAEHLRKAEARLVRAALRR